MAWGIGMNLSWLVGNYISFHLRQAAHERKYPVPSSHPKCIGSLPNGNHPILSPICPMGVADTLELGQSDLFIGLFGPIKLVHFDFEPESKSAWIVSYQIVKLSKVGKTLAKKNGP